ncbi:hypothetical protein AVL63_10320 [Nesterenkonia jeotgali]|uniref:Uncharacterized protein n=1 Tax=Nesterenkonia jeotgali TaxID=317018 RepID=A0A0W8II53_9MICC|nr:hypothetical protein AVL63_10320 [Nesterenkonia jeotgali]
MQDRTEQKLRRQLRHWEAGLLKPLGNCLELRPPEALPVLIRQLLIGLDAGSHGSQQRLDGGVGELMDCVSHQGFQIRPKFAGIGHQDGPVRVLTASEQGVEDDVPRRGPGAVKRLLADSCTPRNTLHAERADAPSSGERKDCRVDLASSLRASHTPTLVGQTRRFVQLRSILGP